jgi:hypothetical protein
MKFALALFALTSIAITGLALGSSAHEASLERTEQQLLEHVDMTLSHRLIELSRSARVSR